MQLSASILAVVLAFTGAQATAIEKRQTGHVSGQTFSDAGCQNPIGSFDFVDDGSNVCRATDFGPAVHSVRVNLNAVSRQFNIYNRTDCATRSPNIGNVITFNPFAMGCLSQGTGLNSYDFGPVDA